MQWRDRSGAPKRQIAASVVETCLETSAWPLEFGACAHPCASHRRMCCRRQFTSHSLKTCAGFYRAASSHGRLSRRALPFLQMSIDLQVKSRHRETRGAAPFASLRTSLARRTTRKIGNVPELAGPELAWQYCGGAAARQLRRKHCHPPRLSGLEPGICKPIKTTS